MNYPERKRDTRTLLVKERKREALLGPLTAISSFTREDRRKATSKIDFIALNSIWKVKHLMETQRNHTVPLAQPQPGTRQYLYFDSQTCKDMLGSRKH